MELNDQRRVGTPRPSLGTEGAIGDCTATPAEETLEEVQRRGEKQRSS